MSKLDADVVIAGGGIAGAVTSIALARRGLSSIVVDRAEFPRDKPCGEGLLPHGLDLLRELGLGDVVDRCDGQPFRGILYRCHGVLACGDFEGGETGRGVRRRVLDESLRNRAQAAGAVLTQGNVQNASFDDAGASLELADGRILRGRFLVGADGPRSRVRHALGLDGGAPRSPRYALRRHFRLGPGVDLPDRVEVNVQSDYELYVTPVAAGTVGVAALCEKRVMSAHAGRPEDRLDELIRGSEAVSSRLAGSTPESNALACGPLRVRAIAPGRGRAFLVGDAAGYVDAITGEGMSLALHTALLCASAIADAAEGTPIERAQATYRRGRSAIFRDHMLLTFGLVELARHPFFARRAIARLGREPALFTRLLSVNNGTKPLTNLGLLDFLKLAVGSTPPRPALPSLAAEKRLHGVNG